MRAERLGFFTFTVLHEAADALRLVLMLVAHRAELGLESPPLLVEPGELGQSTSVPRSRTFLETEIQGLAHEIQVEHRAILTFIKHSLGSSPRSLPSLFDACRGAPPPRP